MEFITLRLAIDPADAGYGEVPLDALTPEQRAALVRDRVEEILAEEDDAELATRLVDDLDPQRLQPPTAWLATQTTYDADAGVYYEPFVKDGRVGYRVASNRPGIGQETYVYLNPSDGSDDGVPTVFVYQGAENDPVQDAAEVHIVPEGVGYQVGEVPAEGAEAEHAAWVGAGRIGDGRALDEQAADSTPVVLVPQYLSYAEQATLLDIVKRYHAGEPASHVAPWIYGLIANSALNDGTL